MKMVLNKEEMKQMLRTEAGAYITKITGVLEDGIQGELKELIIEADFRPPVKKLKPNELGVY